MRNGPSKSLQKIRARKPPSLQAGDEAPFLHLVEGGGTAVLCERGLTQRTQPAILGMHVLPEEGAGAADDSKGDKEHEGSQ
jgi:hypothetical protein